MANLNPDRRTSDIPGESRLRQTDEKGVYLNGKYIGEGNSDARRGDVIIVKNKRYRVISATALHLNVEKA